MNLISGDGERSDYVEAMKNVANTASIQSGLPEDD